MKKISAIVRDVKNDIKRDVRAGLRKLKTFGQKDVVVDEDGALEKDCEPSWVEEEMAKMQENYLLYNVAVRHLSSTITEIKTALNVSANG